MNAERPNETAPGATFEFTALQHARRYRAALVREFAAFLRGRIVEVGAGIGQMTELLVRQPGVTDVLSVEPDLRFCGEFRARLPGQPLVPGTIEDVPATPPGDVILSINVLEHIRDDERELALYAGHLRPRRGHLCLFVPARQEIYAPLDRDFGHFRRYARPDLRARLDRAGFEIVRLHYFNWIGYLGWWFSFCLLRKRTFDPAAVKFFDRIILPVNHWIEWHFCRPPIGQSLLAIARAR